MQLTVNFNHLWAGPEAVLAGLRAVQAGEQPTVTFAIVPHPTSMTQDLPRVVTIALTPDESYVGLFRFTGADGDPRAAGTHALQGMTIEVAAVNLVYALAREAAKVADSGIYRQPVPDQIGQPVEGEPQFIKRREYRDVTRPF